MPTKIPHTQTPDALRNVAKEIDGMAKDVAAIAEKMQTAGVADLDDVGMKTTFLQGMQKLTSYVKELEKELRSVLYQRGYFGTKNADTEPVQEKAKSPRKPRGKRSRAASNGD